MRRNHSDKELDQLQTLKKENQKLKKQISSLRKQLARIDIDRYSGLKDLLDKHYEEDETLEKGDFLDKLKKEWKCYDCPDGTLRLAVFNRRDGTFYFRKCDSCPKRTKSKRYDETVKGYQEEPKK